MLVISILHRSTSIDLASVFFFFSFPVPLFNFGSSLLTAFSNWTTFPPTSRASAPTSPSPMARAHTPMPLAPTFIVVIPFFMPSAMRSPPMRAFFMAAMPVRTPAPAMAPAPALAIPMTVTPK